MSKFLVETSDIQKISSTLSNIVGSIPPPSNIAQTAVTSLTGTSVAGAVDKLTSGASSLTSNLEKSSPSEKYKITTIPNPLEQFASYNTVWTLACLDKYQYNDPSLYRRTGELTNIVFSSAGRYDEKRVKTTSGVPEYYINNFVMKTVIGANQKTGNSNAVKFEWDVYEPYSMGLLLQSLQVAARSAGYLNYLDNAPFCLKMEFTGFGEDGQIITSVKPRYFVLKIINAKFSVTESGSSYKMEGIPYNHQGFGDEINTIYNDLKIIADGTGTVEELLSTGTNSLQAFLNKVEEDLVASKQIEKPDVYQITFPKKSNDFVKVSEINQKSSSAGATTTSGTQPTQTVATSKPAIPIVEDYEKNDIGTSGFGFDGSKGGNYSFRRPGYQIDEKTGIVVRDNLTIDPKTRTFQFSQGQTITAIINQVILSSEYAKKGIVPDSDGFITWWKVDAQVELLDLDDLTGDFARKFTFRVVPFRIHHTVFSNPNAAAIAYPEIAKQIVKKYSYIYTGENVDVLKFDININNLFFTGVNPSSEKQTALANNPDASGAAETTKNTTKTGDGPAEAAKAANFGRRRLKRSPELLARTVGGPGTGDVEKKVAEAFHQAFLNTTTELIKVNLEVLGDPYWIVDSGFANYFASKSSEKTQITDDGTVNYESGDVFIYITFQTPVDVNEMTGLYDFASAGKESPFSGIYRVVMCENSFSDAVFRQKLECIRMPGQANEFKDIPAESKNLPPDARTANATQTGGPPEKPQTTPVDDPAIYSSEGE